MKKIELMIAAFSIVVSLSSVGLAIDSNPTVSQRHEVKNLRVSEPPTWQHWKATISKPAVKLPSKEVLAFYESTSDSLASLKANAKYITSLGPALYVVNENADISGSIDQTAFGIARQSGIPVYGLIQNYRGGRFDRNLAHTILSNSVTLNKLADNICNLVERDKLSGVNIDLENLAREDSQRYVALLEKLRSRFRQKQWELTVSIPAKSDPYGNDWSGGFDYPKIGSLVDRVVIMTYDEHTYGTKPGPIASLTWMRRCLEYSIANISPSKILLGIPFYGYDFPGAGGNDTRAVSYSRAMSQSAKYNSSIQWSSAAQAPFYRYTNPINGQTREVWFENSSSISGKVDLVTEYGIAGMAFWRLGHEDPDSWRVLRQKVRVQ